jgi:hypothetical protein
VDADDDRRGELLRHLPKTAAESKFAGEPFQSNAFNEKIWPYPVPYRCFYSRNVPNLFMAGRDISVTHVALGTTRLMRTHGMMGEVVGMAAAVCKKHGCDPRDVYTTHFGELKAQMRWAGSPNDTRGEQPPRTPTEFAEWKKTHNIDNTTKTNYNATQSSGRNNQ